MTDSPSPILLSREQTTGSNTNLWGPYLVTNQRTVERAARGYQAYTATGDATISWTNYSATNDFAGAFTKINGAPAAAYTITLPSYQTFQGVWNNSGVAATLKNSGGTGITIPASRRALLFGDATDIYEAAPNWLSSYASTLTNAGDIVVKATFDAGVAAAIAAASITNTGQVLVSVADTTSKYLATALTVGYGSLTTTQLSGLTDLQLSVQNSGANEKVLVTVTPGYVGGFLNGGPKSSQFTPTVGSSYTCDFTSASWTINLSGMTTPQLEQRIKLNCFGNNAPFLLGTVNGQTNFTLDPGFNGELAYCGSTWGWN